MSNTPALLSTERTLNYLRQTGSKILTPAQRRRKRKKYNLAMKRLGLN